MVEFVLVALPLTFTGLAGVEFTHWQLARQAVDLALLEAVREGSVTHGDPAAMRRRFDAALLPWFGGGTSAAELAASAHRMARRFDDIQQQTGQPALRLDVLSPQPGAFTDFSDPALSRRYGRPTISVDYAFEGHARDAAAGLSNGIGAASGQTRFDATSLRVRLTYVHMPLLPGLRGVIRAMTPTGDDFASRARSQGGMLTMTREMVAVMQSHPIQWTSTAYADAWGTSRTLPDDRSGEVGGVLPTPGCLGCQPSPPPGSGPGTGLPGGSPAPWQPPGSGGVSPDDPACGVTLCCLAL